MISVLVRLYPIVPVILLTVTVFLLRNCKNKAAHYNECPGIITGFHENTAETRLGSYETKAISPVVSYTVAGRSYEFIGKYCSTAMKVGDEVPVMYHKDDASKAAIKTGVYFGPIVTGALALLSLLPIVICSILKSKGLISF